MCCFCNTRCLGVPVGVFAASNGNGPVRPWPRPDETEDNRQYIDLRNFTNIDQNISADGGNARSGGGPASGGNGGTIPNASQSADVDAVNVVVLLGGGLGAAAGEYTIKDNNGETAVKVDEDGKVTINGESVTNKTLGNGTRIYVLDRK